MTRLRYSYTDETSASRLTGLANDYASFTSDDGGGSIPTTLAITLLSEIPGLANSTSPNVIFQSLNNYQFEMRDTIESYIDPITDGSAPADWSSVPGTWYEIKLGEPELAKFMRGPNPSKQFLPFEAQSEF